MEKKLALLIAFSSVLLISFALFKVFLPGTENTAASNEESVPNSESGYIKLPANSQGRVKYSGKVVPASLSSYELLDENGSLIVTLTADDAKLELAEGRWVEVSGNLQKNTEGINVLKVEAISFK